jgi:hypothetical protein
MTLMYGKNANYLHKKGEEERALGEEEHERKEDEQEKKR